MAAATTTAQLLFGNTDPANAVEQAMSAEHAGLGPLTVSGLSVPEVDVWSTVGRLLDTPIVNVAVRAWNSWAAVRDAKAKSLKSPGIPVILMLGKHDIVSTQSPVVEGTVGPVSAKLVQLGLELKLTIEAVELTVTDGEIVDVEVGTAEGTATLSLQNHKLIKRGTGKIDLNTFRPLAEATAADTPTVDVPTVAS